jgi:uncharacterized membrane protein YphA (DoxX/SURF4 family)
MPTKKEIWSALEMGVRIYLSYILIEYGVSKLTGDMFANTTDSILTQPLQSVDLFHLTWYWFAKNKLLSYTVGSLQILGALLLLFNRTVLAAIAILFPILFSILLIDIYCVQSPQLSGRIILYLALLIALLIRRKEKLKIILAAAFSKSVSQKMELKWLIPLVTGGVVLTIVIELLIIILFSFLR